jgi:glycosyltransferase involved in cell wall biosynthesis
MDAIPVPPARVRILYVITTLPVGGVEQHVLTVVRGLDPARFEPVVVCLGEEGVIGREIKHAGIDVVAFGRMQHKRWDPGIVRLLVRLMRERQVHIVHTHVYNPGVYGRIAAKLAGVPGVVATAHGVYYRRKWKRRLINRVLAHYTDRQIAVSEAVKQDLIRYDWVRPESIEVIPTGIDLTPFQLEVDPAKVRSELGLPPDAYVFGTVGRLERPKGHVYLLRAFERIAKANARARLVLVGDGSLAKPLQEEAARLGFAERVVFAGSRRNVPYLLRAMDVFVFPSLWEGQGLALVEAMASGLPVVASRVGGVSEVITDGTCGKLVPAGSPEALAEAMLAVMANPARAREMGTAARARAESVFGASRMIERLEELYLEIVAEKCGRVPDHTATVA